MARTWTAWAGFTTARTGWRKPQITCKKPSKHPTDPTVHDHLGDVYFKQGKIREAIAQWQSSLKEFEANSSQSDVDPGDMAKVSKKLESARVRVAKEESLGKDKQQ